MIRPLCSSRAASGIIEFSWRRQREATFLPAYAPMFGDLMARYAESAKPFLEDLRGHPPELSPQVAILTVCSDSVGHAGFRNLEEQDALHILPNYRSVAEKVFWCRTCVMATTKSATRRGSG